jgi:hypothetical protein
VAFFGFATRLKCVLDSKSLCLLIESAQQQQLFVSVSHRAVCSTLLRSSWYENSLFTSTFVTFQLIHVLFTAGRCFTSTPKCPTPTCLSTSSSGTLVRSVKIDPSFVPSMFFKLSNYAFQQVFMSCDVGGANNRFLPHFDDFHPYLLDFKCGQVKIDPFFVPSMFFKLSNYAFQQVFMSCDVGGANNRFLPHFDDFHPFLLDFRCGQVMFVAAIYRQEVSASSRFDYRC